ncbi:amidohydrolase [Sphingomonas sp. AP4-R1]|uniref:amidohydrolase family protein n=1 Tax=Sphingomonas sp. AP4-R1 TaxID=2735134 RepID=UPI0014933A98|nr:amidohydrolase family protein [Sphingomonas sp. AP4-R1]QJU60117.1 amidohydrolase [Sphingomonas sp. AP4-R1]
MTGTGSEIGRRALLVGGVATLAAAATANAAARPIPIIDTHIHLFDPRRPQGAPYRGPRNSPTYEKGAFPADYAALVRRHHVIGAIEVEASAWFEDNLWVLETAARDPIMVGAIGNMPIEAADFDNIVARFAKDPLFRGLRYGNLWGYDLGARVREAPFLAGLKRMAEMDLVLDTANPRLDLMQAVVRVSDAVPSLRIVLDHLPRFDPKPEEQAEYTTVLREIAQRPTIFAKLSEIIHPVNGRTATTAEAYRDRLRTLIDALGPDRVLFGSDWPNILQDATLDQVFAVARDFYADRPIIEQEKYFWRNSVAAYKWRARSPAQHRLIAA